MKTQNIIQLIKEKREDFSRQHLKIATYLIENYKDIGFMTATNVANNAGVSQPTVIRFAQFLGFPQYNLFVEAFRKILSEDLTSTDRLNISLKDSTDPQSSSLDIVSKEMQTLEQFSIEFPQKQFNTLVQAICDSDRVFIVGTRGAASLAHYFAYFAAKVKSNVTAVVNGSTDSYDQFIPAGENTLVIPIAFPRYPRETIEMARYCRNNGMKTIGISDKIDSPLGEAVSMLLAIPITYSTLFDSYCSAICLFGSIVTQVGRQNRRESEALSRAFEALARDTKIFIKN